MSKYDHFIHYGTIYGYRIEHETPMKAIEAGAVYKIADTEGYSNFHDTIETINNSLHVIEDSRVLLFIEISDGSLLTIQDVYLLEKRLKV